MNSHSSRQALHAILWSDAELVSMNADYDCVTFEIRESTGRTMQCSCRGYISYEVLGFWDEVIVAKAELVEQDVLIDQSIAALDSRYKRSLRDSGSPERNERKWKLFRLTLLDGLAIKVVTSGLEVREAR